MLRTTETCGAPAAGPQGACATETEQAPPGHANATQTTTPGCRGLLSGNLDDPCRPTRARGCYVAVGPSLSASTYIAQPEGGPVVWRHTVGAVVFFAFVHARRNHERSPRSINRHLLTSPLEEAEPPSVRAGDGDQHGCGPAVVRRCQSLRAFHSDQRGSDAWCGGCTKCRRRRTAATRVCSTTVDN